MDKLYTGTLLVILILSTFILETQTARCCLEFRKRPVRCVHLTSYIIQTKTRQCDLRAIIFETINGNYFCADPAMKWPWRRMKCLEESAASLKKSYSHNHSI